MLLKEMWQQATICRRSNANLAVTTHTEVPTHEQSLIARFVQFGVRSTTSRQTPTRAYAVQTPQMATSKLLETFASSTVSSLKDKAST